MTLPENTPACIQHLYADSKIDSDWVVTRAGSVIEIEKWNTDIGTKPTEAEINAVSTTVEDQWNAQEYARNRQAEYPAIAEQLDEIYHNGIDSWKAVIKVTKDKYPK